MSGSPIGLFRQKMIDELTERHHWGTREAERFAEKITEGWSVTRAPRTGGGDSEIAAAKRYAPDVLPLVGPVLTLLDDDRAPGALRNVFVEAVLGGSGAGCRFPALNSKSPAPTTRH